MECCPRCHLLHYIIKTATIPFRYDLDRHELPETARLCQTGSGTRTRRWHRGRGMRWWGSLERSGEVRRRHVC
eukprot:1124608-Karenia_brevis.AAC.3